VVGFGGIGVGGTGVGGTGVGGTGVAVNVGIRVAVGACVAVAVGTTAVSVGWDAWVGSTWVTQGVEVGLAISVSLAIASWPASCVLWAISVPATCVWIALTSRVAVGLLPEALHAVRIIAGKRKDRMKRIFSFMVHLRAVRCNWLMYNITVDGRCLDIVPENTLSVVFSTIHP